MCAPGSASDRSEASGTRAARSSDRRPVGGLHEHWTPRWAATAELIAELVQDDPAGPLELDLLVLPTPAHRRHISQYLAARPSGPGISAGHEFVTLSGLQTRLRSTLGLPDIDRSPAFALAIGEVLAQRPEDPDLAGVYRHLGAPGRYPGRLQATAHRIAMLFTRYLRQRPRLLTAWAAGETLDPVGRPLGDRDIWQPALWRELVTRQGVDPVGNHTELLGRLRLAAIPGLARRILVATVTELLDAELALLTALACHHEVHLIGLAGIRITPQRAGSDFARSHAHRPAGEPVPPQPPAPNRTPGSLLAKVQAEVRGDLVPAIGVADDSLQIHACAGPDRQVAVLREVLCDLFSTDASLQPRDVLVLCPQLASYAELLRAAFTPELPASDQWHPGHRLRVQLATTAGRSTNPVWALLTRLFELATGRATGRELIALCRLAPIARRFEFDPDDLERLTAVVAQAQIRWGIDPDQRIRNGVPLEQSTWQAGLDRLLLSLAMDHQPAAELGGVTPAPGVGAGETALIGRLAELVTRVARIIGGFSNPTDVTGWVARLRIALAELVDLPDEDRWQLDQALDALTELADAADRVTAHYTAGDFLGLLTAAGRELPRRANHGNGALLITELGDAQALEARVICILGLDDDRFPGTHPVDGDDLLARPGCAHLQHWTQNRRALRRQQLLDALLAAREHFIVITQGVDELTGGLRPEPTCILDLVNATGIEPAAARWRPGTQPDSQLQPDPLIRWHPLQAHDPIAFAARRGMPGVFDEQAARGARCLLAPATAAAPRWRFDYPANSSGGQIELDELIAFLQHPARELLRHRNGLNLSYHQPEPPETLPICPDRLTGWQLGSTIYANLLAGDSPDRATACAALDGWILPGHSDRLLATQAAAARATADRVRAARRGVPRWVDCTVHTEDGELVGRIPLYGARILRSGFRYPRVDDLLVIWLQLLLLGATDPDRVPVGCFVGRSALLVAAPPPRQAVKLLTGLVRLRTLGLRRVLPLPLRTAGAYLDFQSWPRDADPMRRLAMAFDQEDANWHYFFPTVEDLLAVHRPGMTDRPDAIPWFAELARWLLDPIRQHTRRWEPDREVG